MVCLAGMGYFAYQDYKWKRVAERSTLYLFMPTEIKGKDGQFLRRVDLLDAMMANAVKKD